MIRQAAAYATAAGIGSLVGTVVGTVFGITLMTIVMDEKKKQTTAQSIFNITNATPTQKAPDVQPDPSDSDPADAKLPDIRLQH